MRAALIEESAKPFSLVDDVEIEDPRAGEVLVRVSHCGICHSDLTIADTPGMPTPVLLGHEAAGVVEKVGAGVGSVAPGDKVLLTPLASCGRCYFCVRHQPTLCVEAQTFMTGLLPDGRTPLSRRGKPVLRGLGVGGFGERVLVRENGAVKIPADTPLEIACVIGCAVQTGVGAVLNTAKVEEGATVLVTGLGGIGIAVVQGARIANASRIIVSDPVASRREAALRFGATHVLDPEREDVPARARELTGGIGVDYAFEAAGVAKLVEQCLAATRNGGTTTMVGAPAGLDGVTILPAALFLVQEKRLSGCLLGSCHSHRDVPRLLELWRRGALDLEGMITSRRPLAEINAGFDDMRARRGIRTVLSL